MKVLVTGGSGFIGTNLIERLISQGHQILNIDIAVPKISQHKSFWLEVNINVLEDLNICIKSFEPDYIVHLAARVDLDGKEIGDYATNVLGVENLLKCTFNLDSLKKIDDRVKFNTYDEIQIRKQKKFEPEMNSALEFIKEDRFGIEIDLDAIPNIASSAMTLSGFSIEKLRQFIYFFGNNQNAAYLHICEGAPELGEEKNNHLIGKLIGYLVTDFVKANSENNLKNP